MVVGDAFEKTENTINNNLEIKLIISFLCKIVIKPPKTIENEIWPMKKGELDTLNSLVMSVLSNSFQNDEFLMI